ncbi:hypothetical protein D3C78_1931920 [compost metagenome]
MPAPGALGVAEGKAVADPVVEEGGIGEKAERRDEDGKDQFRLPEKAAHDAAPRPLVLSVIHQRLHADGE